LGRKENLTTTILQKIWSASSVMMRIEAVTRLPHSKKTKNNSAQQF
jgi:hypothetical protein